MLLSTSRAGGQIAKAAVASSQSVQAEHVDAPHDALGRTTPRGTVVGFLTAATDQNYETAIQYLDSRARGRDSVTLARQLFFVLDRKLPAKLYNVSNEPQGSQSDPLDSRRELVGSVVTENGAVDIYLERVDRPSAGSIWLFSRETLADIPDVYNEINAVSVEHYLPDFLLKRYFRISLFGWTFFFVFLPLLYGLLSLLNRLLSVGIGSAIRRWTRRPEMRNPSVLPRPVRLLILATTVFAMISHVTLPLLARQAASTVGILLLIVSLVWAMFLVNARCEVYFKRRMERQGRLSATAILRPARRVMDLIAGIVGLMILLHSLGINPSATLAGLGVGGIAVALAAQKTLENVIGGASLIMDDAVRVGDFLKLGDVVGTIEVVGLRSTRVRTLDRTIVTIPNGQVASMTLENFSARDQFWLHHVIGLVCQTASPELNTTLAEIRTLLEHEPRILPSTARVRLIRLAASSLELEVVAYIAAPDWNHFLEIQEELLIRIRETVISAGVEIAYPTSTVYVKKERDAEDRPLLPTSRAADTAKEAIHEA